MGAIASWFFSKFGLYGLLAAGALYAGYMGYLHYTGLKQTISDLNSAITIKDKEITTKDKELTAQAADLLLTQTVNSDQAKKMDELTANYKAVNRASSQLQSEKTALEKTLQDKEKKLKERFAANVENDQCIHAVMPDYVISLLDDAEREARTSANYR